MRSKTTMLNKAVYTIMIVLIILFLIFYGVKEYINKNISIGEKTLQVQSGEIVKANAGSSFSRLVDVVEVGDYVAYDATNNYSYTSPKGSASSSGTSHGNGHSDQTFTSSSNIKWKVLSKDTSTGEIVLVSEKVIVPDGQTATFNGGGRFILFRSNGIFICRARIT